MPGASSLPTSTIFNRSTELSCAEPPHPLLAALDRHEHGVVVVAGEPRHGRI